MTGMIVFLKSGSFKTYKRTIFPFARSYGKIRNERDKKLIKDNQTIRKTDKMVTIRQRRTGNEQKSLH